MPGALEAAVALYAAVRPREEPAEAQRILDEWQGIEELFRIETRWRRRRTTSPTTPPPSSVADTSDQLEADQANIYSYYGIALDGAGEPLPVMHTDHGFVMEFARPSDEYLVRVAATISNDFPAGLMSSVGVMVANPALAAPDTTVTDPSDLSDPKDDAEVPLRDIFDSSQYHGTVVWSWQQAMLASGIRRQIEREDLDVETIAALEEAECMLWEHHRRGRGGASRRAVELGAQRQGPARVPRLRLQPQRRGRVQRGAAVEHGLPGRQAADAEQNPLCTAK